MESKTKKQKDLRTKASDLLGRSKSEKETKTSSKEKPQGKLPQKITPPKSLFGNVFFWMALVLGSFFLLNSYSNTDQTSETRPVSEVIQAVREDKVQDITISGDNLTVLLKDGTKFASKKESTANFFEMLTNSNLSQQNVSGKIEVQTPISWEQILTSGLTFLFPLLILFFLFRQMRSSSGDLFSFGRSRARLFDPLSTKITFNEVAGNKEAKQELIEIVDFLKSPEKYRKLGARIPRGVLLVGASGVGKTLLAKAVAGEANVPFFSVSGSEFMEMLVGVGSARVRDLFNTARQQQPSLIFIDEIDAIGRQRGTGFAGGHDEREQTLNQILIEMDGFDPRTSVIILAATNRPDMLDPALVRAGRFDRRITVPLPDLEDRKEIIKLYVKDKPLAQDFNSESVAKKTAGFSGADLENMINESAILAARSGRHEITNGDLDEASLKVTMGSERKTMQSEEERKMTAYHEAGHALVASFSKDMDPVLRISIVARGGSLGHTSLPPERDRYGETRTRLVSIIGTMLGGRAAEEVVFNESTTGASDDLDRATRIAYDMVTEYGMSSLGLISYTSKSMFGVWKNPFEEHPGYSQEMLAKVDVEVRGIIDSAYETAKEILVNNRAKLDKVALRLLEIETVDGDEFKALLES